MILRSLSASLLLAAGLAAEEPSPRRERPDERPPQGEPGRPQFRGGLDRPRDEEGDRLRRMREAGISPEEMKRLRSAFEKAREDAAVKAARAEAEKAREALREALQAHAKANGIPQPEPPKEGERRERPSPEKMAEVRKAMEGARNDPAVKAAFEKSREAGRNLSEAVRAAVLRDDPSLAGSLDKMANKLRDDFGAGRHRPEGAGSEGPKPKPKGPRPEAGEDERPRPRGPKPDSFESLPPPPAEGA